VAQAMATHQAAMQQWAAMQQSQMTAHMQACMQALQSGLPMPPPPVMPPMAALIMLPPPMGGSPAVSYLTSSFISNIRDLENVDI
jgi:hypothetical protein